MSALFPMSVRTHELDSRLADFMAAHVHPAEAELARWDEDPATRWQVPPLLEALKQRARDAGLWNLFLPHSQSTGHQHGVGLSNLEYARLAERMGRVLFASEVFNCSAPD